MKIGMYMFYMGISIYYKLKLLASCRVYVEEGLKNIGLCRYDWECRGNSHIGTLCNLWIVGFGKLCREVGMICRYSCLMYCYNNQLCQKDIV